MSFKKTTMYDNKEMNILMDAILQAAHAESIYDNEAIYIFLDTPKTSLVVSIINSLNDQGYEIRKKRS